MNEWFPLSLPLARADLKGHCVLHPQRLQCRHAVLESAAQGDVPWPPSEGQLLGYMSGRKTWDQGHQASSQPHQAPPHSGRAPTSLPSTPTRRVCL